MTKTAYFEMCEMLGSEPIEAEIPVDLEDFPVEVQQAFAAYQMLRDDWDSIGGNYLGKSLIGVKDVLEATEIDPEEYKFIVMLIRMIDEVRSNEINKLKSEKPAN
jgi:hypothetical protein